MVNLNNYESAFFSDEFKDLISISIYSNSRSSYLLCVSYNSRFFIKRMISNVAYSVSKTYDILLPDQCIEYVMRLLLPESYRLWAMYNIPKDEYDMEIKKYSGKLIYSKKSK